MSAAGAALLILSVATTSWNSTFGAPFYPQPNSGALAQERPDGRREDRGPLSLLLVALLERSRIGI